MQQHRCGDRVLDVGMSPNREFTQGAVEHYMTDVTSKEKYTIYFAKIKHIFTVFAGRYKE